MVNLYDAGTGAELGTITDEQLEFLTAQLEEESLADQDYYINSATLDLFEQRSAPPGLIALLRSALGDRESMDIRWERG